VTEKEFWIKLLSFGNRLREMEKKLGQTPIVPLEVQEKENLIRKYYNLNEANEPVQK
jgi:hypothetical protein